MPKKFGTNTKSEEARERKAEVKATTRAKLEKEKEDAQWMETDKHVLAKETRRKEEEEKRLAALERKKKNAEIAKSEEEQLSQQYRKPADTKLSRAEIIKKREEAEQQAIAEQKKKEKEEKAAVEEITENVNRILSQQEQDELDGEAIHARSVDQALQKLGSEKVAPVDRHPEKRLKAAYLEYEARELPKIKEENPGLKHSQLKELLWKQWQKSPENPLVQAFLQEQQ